MSENEGHSDLIGSVDRLRTHSRLDLSPPNDTLGISYIVQTASRITLVNLLVLNYGSLLTSPAID